MNKNDLLLICILVFSGCSSNYKEPLDGVTLGIDEELWKSKLNNLIGNGILKQGENKNQFYGICFDSLNCDIELNKGFGEGKLLDYTITFNKRNPKGYIDLMSPGNLHYETAKYIFDGFIKTFGKPDSIMKNWTFRDYRKFNISPIYDTLINNFTAVWYEKNYAIIFTLGQLEYSIISENKFDDFRINQSTIQYKISNYDFEFESYCKAKTANYTKDDYLTSELDKPIISEINHEFSDPDREIYFPLIIINRVENFDERSITSILVDMVFKDNFNNELARFSDIEYDFGKVLLSTMSKIRKIRSFESSNENSGNNYKYHNRILLFDRSYMFNSKLKGYYKLENTYSKGSGIIATLEIKAIKFEDGTILK